MYLNRQQIAKADYTRRGHKMRFFKRWNAQHGATHMVPCVFVTAGII